MALVTLPDGKTLNAAAGATVGDVAMMIGPGLAKAAIAGKIDGEIVDLSRPIDRDCKIEILKADAGNADSLYVLRHSTAHVMAEAICALFPETKLVYGPPVESGFYYDIDLARPLSSQDFEAIEAHMAAIIKEDRPFTRYEMDRPAAFEKLRCEGNRYKIDNAERAEGPISFYVTGANQGRDFEDLCRGPHLPSTGRIGAFKVTQVSGAYYRGDQNEKQLQRVYGTAWPSKKDLDKYLNQIEEAKKRDHRKLGQELGLFTIDPMVGSGLILWKPKGAIVRGELQTFLQQELMKGGYDPVYTPHIGKLGLYRTSGHFPYYKESQFPPLFESEESRLLNELWEVVYAERSDGRPGEREGEILRRIEDRFPVLYQTCFSSDPPASGHVRDTEDHPSRDREGAESGVTGRPLPDGRGYDRSISSSLPGYSRGGYPAAGDTETKLRTIADLLGRYEDFLLRPMNCPHHIRIYASEPRSYRDLPIRLAEFGTVYRYEQSGELSGMTRVRGFTQDDAHLFCRPDQLLEELSGCVNLTRKVLDLLGLSDYRVRVGLRDPNSDKYVGSTENWALAEKAVREAAVRSGMSFTEATGEAAFYGPKIDFIVKDCIGRDWQLGTVQVDYNLPGRFQLTYIGADNTAHQPVMIHRAPFGSMERFTGILIEHFAGAFPVWLAPVQVVVASVSEKSAEYAGRAHARLRAAGIRAELDTTAEKIGPKKHNARKQRVPYILVVGEKEAADGTVNVNDCDGANLGTAALDDFIERCAREIRERALPPARAAHER